MDCLNLAAAALGGVFAGLLAERGAVMPTSASLGWREGSIST